MGAGHVGMKRETTIFVLALLALTLTGCDDVVNLLGEDLGDGYYVISPSPAHTTIKRDGDIIINETVLSYDTTDEYIVGLRLFAEPVICDQDIETTMVTNTRMYFIIRRSNGLVSTFVSLEKFNETLERMGIASDISLEYWLFDEIWNYYSEHYKAPKGLFASCKSLIKAIR